VTFWGVPVVEVAVRLVLRAVDVAGPYRWRWLLVDERSGVLLADHVVELDPGADETEAFEDLDRFVRWRADPDRRVTSEAELVHRVGAWIGSVVLGERIGRVIATAAPVTVRVVVPVGAEFVAFRPLELAHLGGMPLAARGHVALVYDFLGLPRLGKTPVGEALRMLAVFSLPPASSVGTLRRERYELSRLVRRVAIRGRQRVELELAQYGVTRAVLAGLTDSEQGWDVVHLFGHGGAEEFLLENSDGSVDPMSTAELIGLLRPARRRLKLVVFSSCQSAAVTTAQTLRWVGLNDPAAEQETRTALTAAATPVGVARALVAQLGCAVVAMRYPVGDEFTLDFAEALYDRVFRNAQPLDRAVAATVPDVAGTASSPARPAMSVATPVIFGASALGLSLVPPVGTPVPDSTVEAMAWFPAEPTRFVGRVEVMAAASTALAPASGRAAVVFHGMAGAGKTTCAVEFAYRHQRAFGALVFWSAPTDPDQFEDALRLLAVALEAQLADYGVAMVEEIATLERLEYVLPTLTAIFADACLLLVLDNLDTLLTPDGQWHDGRWAVLIGALTGHHGPSRVILTSRVVPTGLNPDTVLIQPVPALSRDESLLLARELPHLRALLHTPTEPDQAGPGTAHPVLGRDVLTLAQGHPALLELADAAAAHPPQLAFQLAEIKEAVDEAPRAAFLTEGHTTLDAEQLLQSFTVWTLTVAATLPTPARLLLQALCRIEETDRNTTIVEVNWAALWRRLDQPGEPPPLARWVAALVTPALITTDPIDDPTDPKGSVYYRIQPAIAQVIHTATPEPVTAAVDAQLADWWTVVGGWEIEQHTSNTTDQFTAHAGLAAARYLLHQHNWNGAKFMVHAGLAAARYLLRQHHWNTASCLLERTLIRDSYSPVTSLAAIPLLRHIAEATGALKDLVVLAAAHRKVDPGEAETLLRRAYGQATTEGEYQLASTTAGDLVSLLRDQGRLLEALTLADQKIEHSNQAGFGLWTQLSDQGRRLQIINMLGHHEQVLLDLPALQAQMAELPDQSAHNDRVDPCNVRKGILDIGRLSAIALQRWDDALRFSHEIATTQQQRGASPQEIARTQFNDYLPLRHLGRFTDADHLLRTCQDILDTTDDTTQLAAVYHARADLENARNHPMEALELQRTSLRLRYLHPDPHDIATAHHHLANYLSHTATNPAEQRAHRLTASLLHHLTGNTHELTNTLTTLASELRNDTKSPHTPALPTTLHEITHLLHTDHGIHLDKLLAALCPNLTTAEHALTNLLTTATISTDHQHDLHQPTSTQHTRRHRPRRPPHRSKETDHHL
jgi:tetratricopeptide (TPR) repeat protein